MAVDSSGTHRVWDNLVDPLHALQNLHGPFPVAQQREAVDSGIDAGAVGAHALLPHDGQELQTFT